MIFSAATKRSSANQGVRARRSTGFFLLILLLVSCVGLLASALKFERRIEEFRAANSDNQGWILSQIEVDYLALALALTRADQAAQEQGNGQIESDSFRFAKLRFDIFYSRISVVNSAIREFLPNRGLEPLIEGLLTARQQLSEKIDAATASNRIEDLQPLIAALPKLGSDTRAISTTALQRFIEQTNQARIEERNLWQRFLLESLVLLSMTGLAAILADRLWRDLEKRTLQAERAASTVSKAYAASLSAVLVSDLDGRIILSNKAAETIFGMSEDQLRGNLIEETIVPRDLMQVYRRKLAQLRVADPSAANNMHPYRARAQRITGDIFPVEISHALDFDLDGAPIILSFIRDISRQVAAENKLRGALETAERAASAKSMFLATMSHEMRTPLHGLMASLDLIDQRNLSESDRHLIETARHCSTRALTQVNEVLQFTRLSESTEKPSEFHPITIATDVIKEIEPLAQENGNAVHVEVSGSLSHAICIGMPSAFSRVLYNLLGNAVKFTQNGDIFLKISLDPAAHETIKMRCIISDTGPGIPEADHERVFELFETLGHSTKQGQSGTGLGLPIARIAVERMGGNLKLRNLPSGGCEFSFEVPLLCQKSAKARLENAGAPLENPTPFLPAHRNTHRDILIVEDNEVNITIMAEMVRRLGYRPYLAKDGREAVELAAHHGFDIILMDVSMPVMDGREASLQIREGGASQHAFILGVTALIEAEDPDWYEEFGMDSVLVKPVTPSQIATVLNEVEQGLVDGETDQHSPTSQHANPMDIILKGEIMSRDNAEFDYDALCELVGPESAPKLVDATLEDVRKVARALETADEKAADLAHRAAGSTAVIGWNHLHKLMQEIEAALTHKQATDLTATEKHLDDLLAQAERAAGIAQKTHRKSA